MEYLDLTTAEFEKPVDDYLRVATFSPEVHIADVPANIDETLHAYEAAKQEQVELLVLPELGLTGYSTADLFHNQHVLEQAEKGLLELATYTIDGPAMVVSAPLRHNGLLYNCTAVLAEGRIAGVVPKTRLPNYKEFYEQRWFTSGRGVAEQTMQIGDTSAPFGTDLLFKVNDTTVGVEICEDMFAGISPGRKAALMGAEVIVNPSASNELVGKEDYRKTLIAAFTGSLICAYVYVSAGRGESVADVIYGGHQMVYENTHLVKERKPFDSESGLLVHDIDRTYLQHDRLVNTTYAEEAAEMRAEASYRTIDLTVPKPQDDRLLRHVEPHPFVPSNPETLDARCAEIFSDIGHALAQRARDSRSQAMVIGLSGGLDSTLALLNAKYACDILGKPYSFIHTITMPAPANSDRTQDNASKLAEAMGTTHHVMPIGDLAHQLLGAIGHDQVTQDIPFENTQARLRTLLLMNYANMQKGFVVGTGDLSESSIGWCTFNGDHMSMFNPNADVPKTLVRHLVRWYADRHMTGEAQTVLEDILDTPISPELTGNGDLSQETEENVGPYELNDFNMYEHLRYGTRSTKIGYLATIAEFDKTYDNAEVAKWLDAFMVRHTKSQWKRNVKSDGTKFASVADSPRGDLRMAPNTSINWHR